MYVGLAPLIAWSAKLGLGPILVGPESSAADSPERGFDAEGQHHHPCQDGAPSRLLFATRAPSAPTHAAAASTEIHGRVDPRRRAVRASAAFTTAKMMRKPALPMVEMLSRFCRFAIKAIDPAVMSSPSIG